MSQMMLVSGDWSHVTMVSSSLFDEKHGLLGLEIGEKSWQRYMLKEVGI